METVEMIAFFVVALIVGGFVILFVAGINPNDIFQSLKATVFPEKEIRYEKIESGDLASRAYNLWERCGLGMKQMSLTLYVKSGPPINKALLFDEYKKLNLCYSIQSVNESCGSRDDVTIINDVITPPAVVTMDCDTATKTLIIK